MTAYAERKRAHDARLAAYDEESNEVIERARKAVFTLTDARSASRLEIEAEHHSELAKIEDSLNSQIRSALAPALSAWLEDSTRPRISAIADAWREGSELALEHLGLKSLPEYVLLEELAFALAAIGVVCERLPASSIYAGGAIQTSVDAVRALAAPILNPALALPLLTQLEAELRDCAANPGGNKAEWDLNAARLTLRHKSPDYWSPTANPGVQRRPVKSVSERVVAPPPPTVKGPAGQMPAAVAARLGV
ncbi:MAG TPA: hypothetical protein VHM70_26405 [Polyangiaceae bacterium]|jgi:hypothetical protein|nr:hypothetical protein [Polyangiaceae bacterium]